MVDGMLKACAPRGGAIDYDYDIMLSHRPLSLGIYKHTSTSKPTDLERRMWWLTR